MQIWCWCNRRLSDAVFRKQHARQTDFRRGKKLGIADHIVTWHKPKQPLQSMSREDFARLPETLTVREVHFQVYQKGSDKIRQNWTGFLLVRVVTD